MQFIKNLIKQTPLYSLIKGQQNKPESAADSDKTMRTFYSQFVSPDSLCFDVGANVGNRTAIFLELGAKVVAVEPQNECVRLLTESFGNHPKLTIVQTALGEADGETEMLISNASTISSLSPEWVEAVKKSGRFGTLQWNEKQKIQITTLDALIEKYGVPDFIKIDVEGYEYEVLKGLSRPVKTLSIEFVPEVLELSLNCLNHLQGLGEIWVNYALGETMALCLPQWVTKAEMVKILEGYRNDHAVFGDIYIQFQ